MGVLLLRFLFFLPLLRAALHPAALEVVHNKQRGRQRPGDGIAQLHRGDLVADRHGHMNSHSIRRPQTKNTVISVGTRTSPQPRSAPASTSMQISVMYTGVRTCIMPTPTATTASSWLNSAEQRLRQIVET